MPSRSLSGESIVQASQILLKQDTLEGTSIQSRLIDVYEPFLLVPLGELCLIRIEKVAAAHMTAQLSEYRRLDTPVPFADVDGLIAFLGNYKF